MVVILLLFGGSTSLFAQTSIVQDVPAPEMVLRSQVAQAPENAARGDQPFETDIPSGTSVTRNVYQTTANGTVEYTERQGAGTEFSSKSLNLSASTKLDDAWSWLAFLTLSNADTTALDVPSDANSVSLGGGLVHGLAPGLSGSATLFGSYSKSKTAADVAPQDNNPAISYSVGASLGLVQVVPMSREFLFVGSVSLSPFISRETEGTVRKTDTDLRADVGLSAIYIASSDWKFQAGFNTATASTEIATGGGRQLYTASLGAEYSLSETLSVRTRARQEFAPSTSGRRIGLTLTTKF